jgi:penicillin-binding protein 2
LELQPTLIRDPFKPRAQPMAIDPDHFRLIREAMYGVVNAGGTGGAARMQVPGVAIAGKTGTAQVRHISTAERRSGVLKNGQLPFKLRDHALFVCFAPYDNPRYAAAVVLEHNGHTVRNLDTPMIGRDIMTYLFDRERALKSLAEVEPTWGGDIRTRMAAEAAAYRAAHAPPPPRPDLDDVAATGSDAVAAATDALNATAEAQAADTARGDGPARTGSPEPDSESGRGDGGTGRE